MNVQCTHCSTVFRVDPAKIPAGGLRARCSICRGVFEVAGPGAADSAAPELVASAPTPQPARAPDPAPAPAPAAGPAFQPAAPAPPPAPTPQPAATAPTPAPAPRPAPAPAPAPSASAPARSPFGAADPAAKARRLARALISDIVTYHPERRDKALADGTLKREFKDEITKSWQEYASQVGNDPTHFRAALNDILARGQQIF
jgi:predicted Zn finger-like uncharacterized protein